jgi:hypothetical protein
VTVWKRILNGIIRNALPHAVLLYVSHLGLIEVRLADVVKKRRDSKRFLVKRKSVLLAEARVLDEVAKALVNVQAMLKQAALVSAVKASAGRSGKEIGLFDKIFKELISALTSYC